MLRNTDTTKATLPSFSLNRKVSVLVLVLTALVVGMVATRWIPVELIPRGFNNPQLRISVPWPDAPPEEVMEKIAQPLEEELRTVRGIDRITSVSNSGSARVFMRFKQNTDMDIAYREVRDRVERSRREFPDDVDHVYIFKDDVSGIPVYVIGVAVSPDVVDAYDLIQKQIIQAFERVDGVASVQAQGLEEKAILIELDRERTNAAGLNIYSIAQELSGDSFTMASGNVRDGAKKLLLRSVARYNSIDDLQNRPVSPNVRLRDIATITYAEPDKDYRVRAMSKPAYAIVVFKEGDANARALCRRLNGVFEELSDSPRLAATEMIELWDQGKVVDDALSKLLQSGFVGAMVAAVVLFLFLRRLRLTMVINLSVPLSLLVGITVMYFAGETLNILTLLSLMVCIGLLVDNAIVVAENIDRMHKDGKTRRDAAIGGAGEISLAITMSTLTTVIVFLPVALVEGPGQFFLLRMAIPITVSLCASLLVALVVVPLAVYFTLPESGEETKEPGPVRRGYLRVVKSIARVYDASFERLGAIYQRLLQGSLVRRLDLVIAMTVIFAATLVVSFKIADLKVVDVQEDEEAGFAIRVETSPVNTLEETEQWFLEAEKVVEAQAEELDLAGWFVYHEKDFGEVQGWFNSPRTKNIKPREVSERILDLLPRQPGMKLTTGQENQTDDDAKEELFRVTVYGEDPQQLGQVLDDLARFYEGVPGVLGIRRGFERPPSEMGLVVDRDRAQTYEVNPQAIAGVIAYALRGSALPDYRADGKEIPVRVRFEEEDRESITELMDFYVPTSTGGFLPVSSLTNVEMLSTPETIVRRDKRIARSISMELEEGKEKETRERLRALTAGIDLPEGVTFGTASQRPGFDEDLKALFLAIGLSVIFIYLLMGLLFESFILPFSIILTIPLASLGVFWSHVIANRDLDFLGVVGIVLLVGVVVNNGIVLIDYVNRLRLQGKSRAQAILTATELRFRPIMMTALTTIGGMVPLAIAGRTEIGLSYTSFALTLIGGMTTSTLLTLLVVPVFYTFFDDLRNAFGSMFRQVWRRRIAAEEEVPGARA